MSVPQGRRAVLAGMLALAGAGLTAGAAPLPEDLWPDGAVLRGEHYVVVGHRVPADLLDDLAVRAERARRRVAAIWGPVRPVILFPETDAEAEALAGAGATGGLAAMATADRVIILPGGYARLSEIGRDVVITHELTHVATGATRGGRVPMWLSEGFADYVGYAASGLAVRTVAAELAAEVRAGVLPARLPGPADFAPGAVRLAQAYEEAWLACRYIAGRYGERTLVRLYGSDVGTVLGLTAADFTAGWRDYLRKELG
ncbi:hypothetical protein [Planobispora longispora]|uniref:Uncharacterized protein n=1 Tax=Planobispora longispora TaxID=28887 RepID=A0A8J3W9Z0_9ACTN|nr:hypothetical protein [Planobispora longispora]BFE88660.1 hypothetical protein GCM10020093_112610 [Planobispora longispora]GIH81515.1 hypothetical protein Plo01_79440 [Planobispora longispora]